MLTLNSVDELISYIGKETGKVLGSRLLKKKLMNLQNQHRTFNGFMSMKKKAKNGPFGSTIAHGFLTLSLAPWMSYNTYEVKNLAHSLNYGVDKVRFISPVKAESNLRGTFKLLEVNPTKGGGYKIKNELTIEIEGQDKPACIAETLGVIYPS